MVCSAILTFVHLQRCLCWILLYTDPHTYNTDNQIKNVSSKLKIHCLYEEKGVYLTHTEVQNLTQCFSEQI